MHHIDKLFPEAVWNYNHKVSGMKLSKNISKHFAHHAFEVWSASYLDKHFGPKNKNIISYSMVAMLYVELVLKKVDWRSLLTRNLYDRTEYVEKDVPNNFSTFQQNVGVELVLDAHAANWNTSRSTKIVRDKDSVEKPICFAKNKSKSEDKKDSSASRKLDISLPRLEGDI